MTDSVDGVTQYTYDGLGQLLTETVNGTLVGSMTYDNYGNILTKGSNTYTYGDSVWKDRLTAFNGQSISYDAQGNPTNYRGKTLTWEKGRQLKSYGGYSYTYNANGVRTSKTVSGVKHTYTLDGMKILKESWGSSSLTPLYDNEDEVCGILYNSTPYYFLKNLQGDVIAITNRNGEVVARYTYDAWGKVLKVTNAGGTVITSSTNIAIINPFRYRGYYYDTETCLYYLQSRYYDPDAARFINADEMLNTELALCLNLYSYCENCPIIFNDLFGYGKTYVIYYDNPGTGFKDQANNSPYYNKNSKNVTMVPVVTAAGFINSWNKICGNIDYVYLYLHGGKGKLYFKNSEIKFPDTKRFKSIKSKKINKKIYLLSCHGGDGKEGTNVAWTFAKQCSTTVVACTGSVSYTKIGKKYYARKAFDWGVFMKFYYQKKYIFWGPMVARCSPGSL